MKRTSALSTAAPRTSTWSAGRQLARTWLVPVFVGALLIACTDEKTRTPVEPPTPGDRPSFATSGSTGVNLDQWANGKTPPTGESWQNGNLNGNNSAYGEDKVVPFRLAIEGLSAGQHFITIEHDFTANGSKAYDFLASADVTETTIFSKVCAAGGGGVSTLCGSSTGAMPNTVSFVDIPLPGDPFVGATGKTVDGAIAASNLGAKRLFRVYGISNAGSVLISAISHAGDVTGNSVGQFLVTFTPDAAGPVLMVWGGHLSTSGYWDAPLNPKGASTISGAPWHMRTLNLDNGGAANQDRSIQPSALVPPVLSIAKVANPVGPVNAGQNIGFDVTVTNNGPGTAFNVTINDPLPGGTGISWSTSTSGCSISGSVPTQSLACTINSLAALATFTASVTSGTTSESCGTITNTSATAVATNAAQVTSNSASVTVNCANVSISKTAVSSPVNAGSNIAFDITVTNTGAGAATNVVFNDPLPTVPAGLSWSIVSDPSNYCSITTGTLNCTVPTLAALTGSYTVRVQSATTLATCGLVSNQANLTSPRSQIATASLTINCPNVSILKTAVSGTVNAGDNVQFDIVASNAGAGTASGVGFTDVLPSFGGTWSIVSQDASNCSISTNTLTCSGITLAALTGSYTVRIQSTTNGSVCTTVENTANLTTPFSGSSKASVTVTCPNLTLGKTADAASVDAGSQIGFTVTVGNTGTGTATTVAVNDPLPAGTGISWSISPASTGWSITGAVGSQVLSYSAATLAVGASSSAHVVSGTTAASCKKYDNTASATVANGTNPSNASASTTVLCPTVTLLKTADAASVAAGSPIGFTVTVSNTSNAAAATNVQVTDNLPAGSGINWSIDPASTGWSITGAVGSQVLSYTAASLAAGASSSAHITSATTGASCKKYDNTASATVGNAASPDNASASTTVLCPNVSLLKTADAASVIAGSQIGFTVTVSNSNAAGTGTATNVAVNDPLPAGSGISWSISPASTGWSITGAVGSQILSYSAATLAAGASSSVHVISGTTSASCKKYDNTASATVGNGTNPGDASASTTVNCLATLTVTKTIVGGGSQLFDFTQTTPTNTSYSLTNAGSKVTSNLVPGSYTVCEVFLAVSWSATATVDGAPATLTNPNASDVPAQDLGTRCVSVTLAYGDSKTVAWTNTPPPGGDARTIGYWKNWSSCASSGGNQYAKAVSRNQFNKTLDGNLPQTIGLLILTADPTGCKNAVNILDKSDLSGKKLASDPAFNLAAQLLAAQLNYTAGAKQCAAATANIANAQTLLAGVKFNGTGTYAKALGSAGSAQANALATKLDQYNNNNPAGCI